MNNDKDILITSGEISEYYGRCWNVILEMIKNEGFPAMKINGRWESNKMLIDKYQRKRIEKALGGSRK